MFEISRGQIVLCFQICQPTQEHRRWMTGSEPKESSKELLVLEHTSKDEHIEKLLCASLTKPKIERLSSSVLQRVQQFLPELQDANESIKNDGGNGEELCCEVDEGFEGPAIEMTLMVTKEDDQEAKVGSYPSVKIILARMTLLHKCR